MKHLLGIDPGGTKCAALLVAPDGAALEWNCHTGNGVTGRDIAAITSASDPLIAKLAGPFYMASTGERHFKVEDLINTVENEVEFIAVTESQAALALAGKNHGIVLLAGTGAFIELLLKDVGEMRLDGMGPLIGDFGSGFWIGQSALRAATRSTMHKRHSTSLAPLIQTKFPEKEFWRIALFNLNLHDRMTVASIAALVNAEAESGDEVSIKILYNAAHELAETVFDALDSNHLLDSEHTLIGTGSVICRSTILWDRLVENIKAFAPNLKFKRLIGYPAVVGVALAGAKTLLDKQEYKAYRKKLLESFKNINTGKRNGK